MGQLSHLSSIVKRCMYQDLEKHHQKKKAAQNLHNFFTYYVAVRIVTAQLESYNPEAHVELMEFLERNSLNDGDEFCATLMRESPNHKILAMRILEVRTAKMILNGITCRGCLPRWLTNLTHDL